MGKIFIYDEILNGKHEVNRIKDINAIVYE